jgi:hypothetical protein
MTINQVGEYIILITGIIVFYAYFTAHKIWKKPLIIFWAYLIVSIIWYALERLTVYIGTYHYDLIKDLFTYCNIGDTNFLRITNHLTNFTILAWFFGLAIPMSARQNARFKWVTAICILFVLTNYFIGEGHNVGGGMNSTLSSLYCAFFSMYLIKSVFRQELTLQPNKNPYFWIGLSLLIPAILSLFVYIAGDSIYKTDLKLYEWMNIARGFIEIFCLILTGIGFHFTYMEKYAFSPDLGDNTHSKT